MKDIWRIYFRKNIKILTFNEKEIYLHEISKDYIH